MSVGLRSMRGQHWDARSLLPCTKGAWPVRMNPVGLALRCRLHCLAAATGAAAMDAIVWDAIVLTEKMATSCREGKHCLRTGEEPPCMAGNSHGDTIIQYWLS